MWTYYPGTFQQFPLQCLLDEISPLVTQNSSRQSCVFYSEGTEVIYSMNSYPWPTSGLIPQIKAYIEATLKTEFDYCLAHIYPDGNSSIAWHNDKESLCEEIISVSFGQTRKFRLRKLLATKGWDAEFLLQHGDVFHMHRGCQSVYEHTVPKETTVDGLRINLTFRKIDRIASMLGL